MPSVAVGGDNDDASSGVSISTMLEAWVERGRQSILPEIFVYLFGAKNLSTMKQLQETIDCPLDFDFNSRTFLIRREPRIVPSNAIDAETGAAVSDLYAKGIRKSIFGKREESFAILFSFQERRKLVLLPLTRSEDVADDYDGVNPVNQLDHIQAPMQSRVLKQWAALQQKNIKFQLDTLRRSPGFFSWLVYALRVTSLSPRHRSHVVVVHVSPGQALGEFESIDGYEVVTIEEAIIMVADTGISDKQMAYYQSHLFDLEYSPDLQEARKKKPDSFLFPIVFIGKPLVYVYGNFTEVRRNITLLSNHVCDQKAQKCFEKLRQQALPSITSPELA